MKKVIYVVLFLLDLGIVFCSCEKVGVGGSSWIVGDWTPVYDDGTTDYYLSFSREGILTLRYAYRLKDSYYFDADGMFDNGTLYSKPDVIWDIEWALEYRIADGQLIAAGIVMGPVTKINNDKFVLEGDNNFCDTYVRIKSFKTK